MWTRIQLKDKAKWSVKRNYWKVVLVSLIVALIASASTGISPSSDFSDSSYSYSDSYDEYEHYDSYGSDDHAYVDSIFGTASILVWIIVAGVIAIPIFLAALVLGILVINPIEIGTKRFFLQNLNQNAEVKEVGYGFDHSYKNIVGTMFFRDLYTFLWTLLFVIPGIVKSYEYRMIPYLLAEYPDMPRAQAFETSKQMMSGQKWNAFVLDLSFIPWDILAVFTLGILGIFYVGPYENMTNAALYEALKFGGNRTWYGQGGYANGAQGYGTPMGGAGAQMYGNPMGGAGAQPYGTPMGGAGAQAYGNPMGGAGAQPYGTPMGGAGAQPYGTPMAGNVSQPYATPTNGDDVRNGEVPAGEDTTQNEDN